ncbi:MAG: type II toxin-antitoxin system PemK/MazF family toxin [Saprospiraceae bacterium]|nr:type II toxin-antitoxin system PemK/MazF family toxin [Saprospiraceae bacterium]
MKQREIWYADLNPTKGSEQAGVRPVIILSGNALNDHMPIVIVAPLSTKIKKYKGNPVLTPDKTNGLKSDTEIILFQIKAISKLRFQKKIGEIDVGVFNECVKTVNDLFKY